MLEYILGQNSKGEDPVPAPDSTASLVASANASKDAQIAQSNNNLLATQTQAAVMELGILENSKNAQFQTLSWLTERLDAHDVKLQIAVENAKLSMAEEQNRHAEAKREIELEAREIEMFEQKRKQEVA